MSTLENDSNYNLFLQLYLPAEPNRNYRIIVSARTEPELSRDSLNVYTQLLIQWSSQHNYAAKIMYKRNDFNFVITNYPHIDSNKDVDI